MYFQIRVHPDEVWMQGFAWLGKIFFETSLVFGGVSSAGIFDRVAKIVLFIARARVMFPRHLTVQVLDDACACSPEGSDMVDKFYRSYWDTCEMLNIKLADPSDPDKAFGPRTEGQVLGVDYDSVSMTWSLREDKITAIMNIIEEVMDEGEATVRTIKRLCGKLIDIRNLIKGGKFHLAHLMMATKHFSDKKDMEVVVEVDDWCREDLYYWSLVLPVYSHRSMLQDPDRKPDPWAVVSYSDAAGGSESYGRGVGTLIMPHTWTYVPWNRRINEGWLAYDGKSLSHKLSVWELCGPLLTLVIGGNTLTGKQVKVFVDNEGTIAQLVVHITACYLELKIYL